jgi:hypothetical protein
MRTLVLSIVAFGCVEQPAEKQRPDNPATEGSFAPDSPPEPPGGSDPTLRPIVHQVVPLVGGGIAAGAEWVGAVDPDDDLVELEHVTTHDEQVLQFEDGSAPAAIAWTSSASEPERAHVLLRGNGARAVVEPGATGDDPTLLRLAGICPAPRGIAWDDLRDLMWVACAGGELVSSTSDGVIVATFWLDPDLRDIVVLADGRAMVSRMRAAEVLIVDLDKGAVTARFTPPEQGDAFERPFVPRVLRRMVPLPDGGAIALYQTHDTKTVPTSGPDEQEDDATYGGDGNDCGSIVRTVMAEVSPDLGFTSAKIVDAQQGYIVDVVQTGGWREILATAKGIVKTLMQSASVGGNETCVAPVFTIEAPVVPTGLTVHGEDVWVTTREPFTSSTLKTFEAFSGLSPGVTPLRMFHDSPAGIACASCHAEGGDDAHTWTFAGFGERRTQALGGILVSETAPFHWSGELPTFDHLLADVGVGRMGLEKPTQAQSAGLQEFLDLLPAAPPSGPPADPALVVEGAVLFGDETVGCTECHSGWRYTNGDSADVGTGGTFQVPSLIGVGARLPLMHDGCAQTLRQRFDDVVCGGDAHGNTASLTSPQIDALVAFLASL